MRADVEYLDLSLDVLDQPNQRVQVRPDRKPADLIAATLIEFRELAYLTADSGDYRLLRAHGEALDSEQPLGRQVSPGDRLILAEKDRTLPSGTQRPSRPIYLRDHVNGRTYKLAWLPAIIGRSSVDLPQNDWVAVDLSAHDGGLRVSRRHAWIWEEDGAFYVEALSTNPVSLLHEDGRVVHSLGKEKRQLRADEVIRFDRSNIRLQFIVRED